MNATWWIQASDLNDEQKSVIDLDLDKSSIIIGPPGSGKTNLLLLRASQLVRSGKPDVLILVFSRTLRDFLETGGAQYAFSSEKIKTGVSWAREFLKSEGVSVPNLPDFEEQRAALITSVKDVINRNGYENIYDAIILDEAQDYHPEEINIFFKLARVVYAASDSHQQIYKNDPNYWEHLISKFGNEIYKLKYHYRNGRKICAVADELKKGQPRYEPLVPFCNYDEKRVPSSVDASARISFEAMMKAVTDSLGIQLSAYPGEFLGVICPTNALLGKVIHYLNGSSIASHVARNNSGQDTPRFREDTPICVCTAHAAKGLEFRAVHFLEPQMVKTPLNRNLIYTAITRAKTSLSIHHTDNLPGYIEKALQILNPIAKKATLDELF